VDGAAMVAKMVKAAQDRIIVMPGCGIRPDNVISILENTGAHEVHIALEKELQSEMQFRKAEIPMGGVDGREYLRFVTQEKDVRGLVQILSR
jgi:copper homeostasis protein